MQKNHPEEPDHIVVIGSSAGGLNALYELVSQFNPEWNAAFFIVLHLSRKGISDFLVHRLQQQTSLHCVRSTGGQKIEKGNIYVATPNLHLLVAKGTIKIGHGPEENRWRPSIDVLFRSAAAAYDSRVTGILLTGLLDDGTSGMWAIKRAGGTLIVQDPNEAEYPDMPLSVLNRMEVDYCLSLSEMGNALDEIFRTKEFNDDPIPRDILAEAEIAERMATGIEVVSKLGEKSFYSCPDCGGMLFLVENGKINRYRCHIGHSYSEADLATKQEEALDSTLWVALRMMEERKNLLTKMENDARLKGFSRFATQHQEKAAELQQHIENMKEMLQITNSEEENNSDVA
jgi:two-component system, chemotaxis family, protein-glutamate methylesterase/glutaminase